MNFDNFRTMSYQIFRINVLMCDPVVFRVTLLENINRFVMLKKPENDIKILFSKEFYCYKVCQPLCLCFFVKLVTLFLARYQTTAQ